MRLHRFLGALGLILAGAVSVASPAQAASGPWLVASAGNGHTCAINTTRSLFCWGYNGSGQIGDGTTIDVSSPKRIGASGVWASVTTGDGHTCAISVGKSLYCWGHNGFGQIGDGESNIFQLSPKKIGTSGVWASVTAGGTGGSFGHSHTCAISTGKSLYCWGVNFVGQIGDGTTTNRHSPKKIGTSGVWASVTGGGSHTCAISTGQSLYCWGANGFGTLGDGTTDNRPTPKRIGTSGAWATVNAGVHHTCALTTGRSLYCWGRNDFGEIGDNTTIQRDVPRKIGTTGAWASPMGAGRHTCAITTGKRLYCWGANDFGQLGNGVPVDEQHTPQKIGDSGVWASVTGGEDHTCAISTGKRLYCWGNNSRGQIGDGTSTDRPAPKMIP